MVAGSDKAASLSAQGRNGGNCGGQQDTVRRSEDTLPGTIHVHMRKGLAFPGDQLQDAACPPATQRLAV